MVVINQKMPTMHYVENLANVFGEKWALVAYI